MLTATRTFVAAAPDMMPLAVQAARVACSYLTPDQDGFGDLGSDVFVLAVRSPDGMPLPAPQWASYDLPESPDCPHCSP